MLLSSNAFLNDSQPMSVAYLDKLNPEQRRAIEQCAREKVCSPCAPLVIAGGGSGKTNMLARRVAHLIVNGAEGGCLCAICIR